MFLAELMSSLTADPDGGFSVEIPEQWLQGRTAFGGLNAALAARAARALAPDAGPLRALQIAFIGPAADRLRYTPAVLRQGRSVTFVGVDCHSGDTLCARLILTYGRGRETEVAHSRLSAPLAAAPEDCPEIPIITGTTPAFLANMELRMASGDWVASGGRPEFAWWVRHREAAGLDPESALLAVADVLPPAVAASRTEFRPASSVTWTVDLAEPLPDPAGWYLLSTTSDHAADGYSLQAMSTFSSAGQLAAVGRQTVAVF